MSNWKEVPFSALLEKVIDNRGKTCPTDSDGIPLIATNCIKNGGLYPVFDKVRFVNQETYDTWFRGHPEPGDMIFVTKGTPGRVCWTPDPINFCIAQDMVSIRADHNQVYPKYLFAALRSKIIQSRIEGLHVGSLIPHFKKGNFNELMIPVPTEEEQLYIGDIYFDTSSKIDLLLRQNRTLEKTAKAIFRHWFVDNAKDEWEWKQLDNYTETVRGLSYKGAGLSDEENGIPMHNLNSVYEGGGYKYDGIKFYSGEYRKQHLVSPGDLIITNTEQGHDMLLIGFPAIVPQYFGEIGIFSQHIYKLQLKDDYLTVPFLYYLLMTFDMREQIAGSTNGSTVNMLPKDGIEWARFRVPPKSKIDEFTQLIQPMLDKQETNFESIKNLEALRDTLLPKLMSGEVTISDE